MDPFLILILAITVSYLLPISAGIINYKSLRLDTTLLLSLYIFTIIEESLAIYIYYVLRENIFWLQHIYGPVEYSIIVVVFSRWIENTIVRKSLWASLPVYIFLSIATALTFEPITESNSFMASISCVIHIFISFYVILSIVSKGDVFSNYRFWFCLGILIY